MIGEFMGENVPRRLRRFYRKNEQIQKTQGEYFDQPYNNSDYYNNQFSGDEIEVKQKRELGKLPSMNYEDLNLNEKNAKDIENFEKENRDKTLALEEIKKFKKENNRMPTKKETERIAENLYTQIKNNPIEYPNSTEKLSPRESRRLRRSGNQAIPSIESMDDEKERVINTKSFQNEKEIDEIKEIDSIEEENTNIKDLFEDKTQKKEIKDEFDLGLDDDFEDDEEEERIEDINFDQDTQTCPNCKNQTQKTIYCPKCGFAYCNSCTKQIIENSAVCPKCGEKTKL